MPEKTSLPAPRTKITIESSEETLLRFKAHCRRVHQSIDHVVYNMLKKHLRVKTNKD
jgi:hypothetical protein